MDRKLIKEYYQEVYRQGHEVLEEAEAGDSGKEAYENAQVEKKANELLDNYTGAKNEKKKAEALEDLKKWYKAAKKQVDLVDIKNPNVQKRVASNKSDFTTMTVQYLDAAVRMIEKQVPSVAGGGGSSGGSKVAINNTQMREIEKRIAEAKKAKNKAKLVSIKAGLSKWIKSDKFDEAATNWFQQKQAVIDGAIAGLGGGSGDDSAVAGKGDEKDIYYYPGDKKYEYKLVKVGDKWQWHASVRGKNKWRDVTKYVGSKLDKKAKNKDGDGPPVKVGGGSRSSSKKPKTGFKPKVGQEIEAKWEGTWHDAKVVSVEGDTVEVKWPGYKGTNKVPVSDTRARVTDSGLGRDPENFANYTMNTFPKIADQYAGAPSKMTFTRTSNRKGTPLYRSKESWEISGAMGAKVLGIAVIQGQGENARILVQQNTVGGKPPKKEWQTLNVGMSYEDIDQARLGESFIRPTKNILKEIILQEMLKGN